MNEPAIRPASGASKKEDLPEQTLGAKPKVGPSGRRTWASRYYEAWVTTLLVTALWSIWGLGFLKGVETVRCAPGLLTMGPRCCAPGQKERAGICIGKPEACPSGFLALENGCAAPDERRTIQGGVVDLGPDDWHSAGLTTSERAVESFEIDAHEVSWQVLTSCVEDGPCSSVRRITSGVEALRARTADLEPGSPVTLLTPDLAEAVCRARGGRLPSLVEWAWALRGPSGHKFPWGPTGLVCRRASFGLVKGPCAEGATQPELTGARPDGMNQAGVFDLVGNVAEWVRLEQGRYRAMGGSFRSKVAGEFSLAAALDSEEPTDHIGFRCVYSPSLKP